MKYIDADKLIAEIEGRMKDYNASIEKYYNKEKSIKAERDSWKWAECKWFLNLITSLQQEQPLTIEKVVEQCKKFGGNPEVIQHEQKCIFGNIPSEDICSVCSAYCSLRVPKTKVSTSTEIATPSGQVEELTFEEYLRGVFEINNGIENDPDNLVRIHAPELLKLARKQEQPELELSEHRIADIIQNLFPTNQFIESESLLLDREEAILFARHFYELGQRTKYQQDREEFAKLKAKEWQEGYDEGYTKGLNARKK